MRASGRNPLDERRKGIRLPSFLSKGLTLSFRIQPCPLPPRPSQPDTRWHSDHMEADNDRGKTLPMSYPIPANEKKRLEALRLYQALDAAPDQAFHDIAAIAAQIANAPVALISLVGETHERYEANIGFTGNGVPRQESFCTHTILGTEALVVEDATADARFAQNPHVTKTGGVRFYAGAPIVDREGHGLGSVCVVDTKPRQLAPDKVDVLMRLARTAMRLLEQRRTTSKLAEALQEVKTEIGRAHV